MTSLIPALLWIALALVLMLGLFCIGVALLLLMDRGERTETRAGFRRGHP